MKVESEPELRRVPLEEVCMSVLASNFAAGKGCLGFLSEAPQPPSPESVMAALNNLEAIGAIEVSESGTTERLTTLGKHLAKLPLGVKLGKMLIFGALFSCIEVRECEYNVQKEISLTHTISNIEPTSQSSLLPPCCHLNRPSPTISMTQPQLKESSAPSKTLFR